MALPNRGLFRKEGSGILMSRLKDYLVKKDLEREMIQDTLKEIKHTLESNLSLEQQFRKIFLITQETAQFIEKENYVHGNAIRK